MLHYHILNDKGKTVDIRLHPTSGKPYKVCNLSFAWTGADGHWRGDKYNSDGMCINHCGENLEEQTAF